MNVHRHFAQSYTQARDKFVAAAGARSANLLRHVHPALHGVEGEDLSIDLALLGKPDAASLLLLTSGTHGVEGFCGSGCQVALLHDDQFMRAIGRSDIAVLMLHALNPYGFSHLRRVNEDNVDLNRNFVDFGKPLPVNSAYAEIHSLLLPATWPPTTESEARLDAWVAQHGRAAYQAAVSIGQYAFHDGMFYGGSRPTWSNRTLRSVLREHVTRRRRLAWIDFHTGLGPRGHGEKIYAGLENSGDIARTKAVWGREVTSVFDGSSSSARIGGNIGGAARDECPATEFCGIALEYGTHAIEQVLEALRVEHWFANHPEASRAHYKEMKRKFRDAFYVDDDDWKETVYTQALAACLRAVEHLSRATAHA
jgi:Protein of unknown function (DUF2817)